VNRVLFFDGYCSLCNGLVDWMMRHDRSGSLKFASLQGKAASAMLPPERVKAEPDTVLYMRDGEIYDRSAAVLMALKDLGGIWALASVLFLIPSPLRNLAYRFVARIRYKVFGKRDTCRMPTPEERERLLP
jgi:predicted DCC family thiol-disulfide oxidoreductase YuxK